MIEQTLNEKVISVLVDMILEKADKLNSEGKGDEFLETLERTIREVMDNKKGKSQEDQIKRIKTVMDLIYQLIEG